MNDSAADPAVYGLPPLEVVDALHPEALPGYIAYLAALQARAVVRMSSNTATTAHPTPPVGDDDDQLLTEKQAAAFLAVPAGHVGNLGRSGALPRVKFGKYVRFRLGDLRLWVSQHHET